MDEVYISVDAEMSGPAPGIYSMLSIGATVVGRKEDTFYAELKPLNMNFVPEALAVAGFSLKELDKSGRDPKEAINSFATWVQAVSGDKKAVFVSFGTSDWLFVKWYLVNFGHADLFGPNSVDMKSYYMGMEDVDWRSTKKDRIKKELLRSDNKHTHNALDDAKEQADIFSNFLKYNAGRSERTKLKAP
jgi:hypothetical protein